MNNTKTFILDKLHKSKIIDYGITLKILEFVLNLVEKVKPGFSLPSMCIFPESNGAES